MKRKALLCYVAVLLMCGICLECYSQTTGTSFLLGPCFLTEKTRSEDDSILNRKLFCWEFGVASTYSDMSASYRVRISDIMV